MIVKVTRENVTVEEADDLRRLSVQSYVDADSTFEHLARVGLTQATSQIEEDGNGPHVVWLSTPTLRKKAHEALGAPTDDWEQSWLNMILFADQHGWLRDETYVRAHVEMNSLDGTVGQRGPEVTA